MPGVAAVKWDWGKQILWLRFKDGEVAEEQAIRSTIEQDTMFTPGKVTFLHKLEELPVELR